MSPLAPVQRCPRTVRCVACAVFWATWLLFIGVLARCVVLRVRCLWPLGSCSAVCPLGVLCCVCGVLGHLAPVHPCAPSVYCVACAVCLAPCLMFSGLPAQCVVLRVQCRWPLGWCSSVCLRCVLSCLCGVPGHLAPVHRSARSVCLVGSVRACVCGCVHAPPDIAAGRAHVHPDGGCFVAGRGWNRCPARTPPSGQRVFRSWQGRRSLRGAHSSIWRAAVS